ncbi:PAS domain-containing protein [Corynebacterium diphtheriae]|nr:PAS domain-containing protein [Corynebacterium diphtheriae]CAB0665915.1 PAS domain-containing protein [Corynebacterium diphtheriae]
MERVAPNGQFKDVGVDQLFFSTTDAQGRIQETNNTFVELSHYTEEELRNAAHNIIRHPFMPGGVFKIMWDKLQRGETFAGYVRNLARTGETYDVFATVTPIPGTHDYLSVRQRPCHDDHRALAMTIYAEVGDYEAQLRKNGMPAREAAEAGARLIGDKLRESGFDNFDACAHAMLPWEVFCRENMSTGLPQREISGELGTELAQAHDVHAHLDEWMLRLDELLTTAQQLGEAREELVDSLGQTSSLGDTIDARSASETLQIVQFQLNVWKGMQKIVDSYVVELAELITTLANDTLRERFQISVSRLHTAMLATFLAELIDGTSATANTEHKVALLKATMRDSLESIDRGAFHRAQLVRSTISCIRTVTSLMESPRGLLTEAIREAQSINNDELSAAIATELERSERAANNMHQLVATLESTATTPDIAAMLAEL